MDAHLPLEVPASSGKKRPRQLIQALCTRFAAQARFLGLSFSFSFRFVSAESDGSRHCAGAPGG
jgi:hypothetical protein